MKTGGPLRIGYAPERFSKLNFNAVEYLRSMGKMRGIPDGELTERIKEVTLQTSKTVRSKRLPFLTWAV